MIGLLLIAGSSYSEPAVDRSNNRPSTEKKNSTVQIPTGHAAPSVVVNNFRDDVKKKLKVNARVDLYLIAKKNSNLPPCSRISEYALILKTEDYSHPTSLDNLRVYLLTTAGDRKKFFLAETMGTIYAEPAGSEVDTTCKKLLVYTKNAE